MNVPIIKIKIQGVEINAIFDTGAMHTVLNSNYKQHLFDRNCSTKYDLAMQMLSVLNVGSLFESFFL